MTIDADTTACCTGSTGSAGGIPVTLLKNGEEVDSTVSAADGRYSFAVVSPGGLTVRAARGDWGIATGTGGTLTPGSNVVTVRALDHTARWRLEPSSKLGDFTAITDSAGRARFAGLPAGSYAVTVRTHAPRSPTRR